MKSHTPGPWKHIVTKLQTNDSYSFHSIMGGTKIIAHITDGTEENTANANLIASAPEILRELKNLVSHWEEGHMFIIEAEKAIKKAEGK